MKDRREFVIDKKKEKVLLVVIEYKRARIARKSWSINEIIDEMKELVVACNGEVVDSVICKEDAPSARYLIGKGKVHDIAALCSIKEIDLVIFSCDLKGSQQRNLENETKVKTIDRTQLILDIFARRATSKEGKMQVELAQLQYLLPRLVGKGVELSRLGGGIGTLGPGETKLEMDRRRISTRITRLKKNLSDVVFDRSLKRKKRKDKGVPTISLVGYTNAGKSTLLNVLTAATQITRDGLFTTLDSLARQLVLTNNQKVILSDTVGFMHELPHHLIESFKATLEEVKGADLLLHVLDVSHPNFRHLFESVISVLEELGSSNKPMIIILNKIDKLTDKQLLGDLKNHYKNAVCISAKNKENIDELLDAIRKEMASLFIEIDVSISIGRMDLVNLAHNEGQVHSIKYDNDRINIRAALPASLVEKFC